MPRRTSLIPCTLLALFALACGDADKAQSKTADPDTAKGGDKGADKADKGEVAKPDGGEADAGEVPAGPSSEAARTFVQTWATPTGKPTARVAAVYNGRVYALAGEHMEFGTPAATVVALNLDSGAIEWTHAAKDTLELVRLSDALVELRTISDAPVVLAADTGKPTKPTKAASDATVEPPEQVANGCEADGAKVRCEGWSGVVEERGPVSALQRVGERVCYAVSRTREVRCRAVDSGDLEFAIPVPPVPDVKDPDAVNFSVHVDGDRVVVGNYDGTVLAFGPG